MSLYDRVLGHPLVYDYIRPAVVGGIDNRPTYDNVDAGPDDVVLDIGCGTGDALRYLPPVREYHGFDTDSGAIRVARGKAKKRSGVISFSDRAATWTDFEALRPTRVLMCGLLHHLPDALALELLGWCRRQSTVVRVATTDVVFLPGHPISNALASMDRGQHVRTPDGYQRLAREASLTVQSAEVVPCRPVTGLALYYLMALAPAGESA